MHLYSTKNKNLNIEFEEAVLRSLPQDNGLYMPHEIPLINKKDLLVLLDKSFEELSFEVAKNIIGDSIPEEILKAIVLEAINFPAPLVMLEENIYCLELFHGPTLAFKDFGARFMSRVMNYYKRENEKLFVLVATSGDTGGAVASGFYNVEGIEVVILFPKGKVSPLQQKQLTTLGKNISAIEIDGTFDDCQSIVKQAFLDEELIHKYQLSSANSINISRLIPQSFYYFNALRQLEDISDVVFVVPSGNFGNLTAGILAQKMGLPIKHFVAATNINDVVPEYIKNGHYNPRQSEQTISNAMDVGNPSNFYRMETLYGSTWNTVKENVSAYAFTDGETKNAMKEIHDKYGYIIDPHGAVAYLGALKYKLDSGHNGPTIFMETAHPSKFMETVESVLNIKIEIPERLASLSEKNETFTILHNDYNEFKNWFIKKYH